MQVRLRAVGACLGLVALVWTLRGDWRVAIMCCLLGFGAARGRRPVVAIGLILGTVTLANAISTRSPAMAAIGTVTIAAVITARPLLVGWPDGERQRVAAATSAVSLILAFVTGVWSTYAGHAAWRPTLAASDAVRGAVHRMAGLQAAVQPTTTVARSAAALSEAFTALGLLLSVALLLLPDRATPSPVDDAVIVGLVMESTRDSLAPFAARTDKDHIFTDDRRSVIGYRVVLGVALAGGGPVGGSGRQAAFLTFLDLCSRHGWLPAIIGADARTAVLARHHGFRVLKIGDEAVVDLAEFTLATPHARNVRQAVHRSHNFGVTVTITEESHLTSLERVELRTVAERSHKGSPGRGFSMILDGFLHGTYPGALIVSCRDRDGCIVALQRYLPYGHGDGLTLDSMYRLPTSPNGVNERMIVDTISWARRRSYREISLNFAAFRSLYDRPPSLTRNLEHWLVHRLDPLVSVESLYRFNAKFAPRWRPRYVVFPTIASIALVLPAALIAEFGRPPRATRGERHLVLDRSSRTPAPDQAAPRAL